MMNTWEAHRQDLPVVKYGLRLVGEYLPGMPECSGRLVTSHFYHALGTKCVGVMYRFEVQRCQVCNRINTIKGYDLLIVAKRSPATSVYHFR